MRHTDDGTVKSERALSLYDLPRSIAVTAQKWPERLWLVRHGQSAGNVARDLAHERGETRIPLEMRDVDIPLSQLGEQQADAFDEASASINDSAKRSSAFSTDRRRPALP